MKFLLFLFLIAASTQINAKEINWYRVASNATITADWLQTRYIAKYDSHSEMNPILGRNPSVAKVDLYFISSLLFMNALGEWLPSSWSDRFYFGLFVSETAVVTRNKQIGVGVYFGY
jgi:hypothetical protein